MRDMIGDYMADLHERKPFLFDVCGIPDTSDTISVSIMYII